MLVSCESGDLNRRLPNHVLVWSPIWTWSRRTWNIWYTPEIAMRRSITISWDSFTSRKSPVCSCRLVVFVRPALWYIPCGPEHAWQHINSECETVGVSRSRLRVGLNYGFRPRPGEEPGLLGVARRALYNFLQQSQHYHAQELLPHGKPQIADTSSTCIISDFSHQSGSVRRNNCAICAS